MQDRAELKCLCALGTDRLRLARRDRDGKGRKWEMGSGKWATETVYASRTYKSCSALPSTVSSGGQRTTCRGQGKERGWGGRTKKTGKETNQGADWRQVRRFFFVSFLSSSYFLIWHGWYD